MTHYVLVHGAWESAWSWDETVPFLHNAGRTLTAVNLPGTRENRSSISDVTMENYVQTVVRTINKIDHKVILVGHSLAGAIISQVAEVIPEKIEKLVYIAAFLLQNGDSILEAMQRDPAGEFLPELIFSKDETYATASERTWREKAFHDVDKKLVKEVLPLVDVPQATEPFMAKVEISTERFGSIPKIYVRTSLDKMVSPQLQTEMLQNFEVDKVYVLESGHFPTLSVPEELATLLL